MMNDTARLFLGLELNDEARGALSAVRRTLASQGVPGKFHAPELYHLTLRFLGATPIDEIPLLRRIMDSVPCEPFALTLNALGTFKNGSILWAGVKPCPELTAYQSRLTAALEEAGFPPAEDEYRPHITLARQVRSALPAVDMPEISFPIRHVTLFESTRVDGAPAYVPLYRRIFP